MWDVTLCIQSGEVTAELGAAKCYTKSRQHISCRRKRLYFPLQLWLFLLAANFLLEKNPGRDLNSPSS